MSDTLVRFLSRPKVVLTVTIDIDPVPGAFDSADYIQRFVQRTLDDCIKHYNPKVVIADSYNDRDGKAVLDNLIADIQGK